MNTTAVTPERPCVSVRRPTKGDMQMAIHGIRGIFWALNLLVLDRVADDVAKEEDIANGIANLIVAGEELAKQLSDRF